MADILLPDYGHSTLADVMGSVAAAIAPENFGSATNVLGLPAARRYVLVMVDGLGHELLASHAARAPYLGGLLPGAVALTAAVPSTTATSLTSLGVGMCPGQHGMVGYSFRVDDEIINALAWDQRLDPYTFQPNPTWFEALSQAGVSTSTVSINAFAGSGLTLAGLRGSTFYGITDEDDPQPRIAKIVEASKQGDASFVYTYERRLDHCGHGRGVASQQWSSVLDEVDDWIEQLRDALDPDTVLLVTGDHGMVDVPKDHQIILEETTGLPDDIDLIGGEGRLRQLYTTNPAAVAERWANVLGERAVVRTRAQAIADGWFGPVGELAHDRIGDVLVAMQGNWAVMTATKPKEMGLVGQHASLTSVEMRVPLLIDAG